jgi:DNA-binding response OmpR family regulator
MTIGVLVLEDDPASGTVYTGLLDHAGYRVALATTLEAGLAALEDEPGACIVDVRLPGGASGIDFVRAARRRLPDCRLVVVTANPIDQHRAEALEAGADGILEKPVRFKDLFDLLPMPKGPEVVG